MVDAKWSANDVTPTTAPKARVLVVDDDESVRAVCMRILTNHGFEVRDAYDAFAAMRLTRSEHFDVALVDLRLPSFSGAALMTLLRSRQPSIGLVAMTGWADDAALAESRAAGCDAFLGKPYVSESMLLLAVQGVNRSRN